MKFTTIRDSCKAETSSDSKPPAGKCSPAVGGGGPIQHAGRGQLGKSGGSMASKGKAYYSK